MKKTKDTNGVKRTLKNLPNEVTLQAAEVPVFKACFYLR